MLDRLAGQWSGLSGNVRGAIYVCIAALAFSFMGVIIKIVGQDLPVWQIVVLRSAIGLVIVSPAVWRAGPNCLRTDRIGAHIFRSALGMGGLTCFFFALKHLDLALVTTLGFTRVLFVIVLAVIFLGEVVRWRRTLATLIGFLGVIICVYPSGGSFDPWTLIALLFALFGAGVTTTVKRLTTSEGPLSIVVWTYIVMGLMAAVPAVFVWQPMTYVQFALIMAMGLCSTLGQTTMVLGLRVGEATAVTPFDYTRLLWATLLGYLFFADMPASNTLLGASVIVASTLYIAWREASIRAARRSQEVSP